MKTTFRIKEDSGGTYFRGMTAIGPAFGASRADAATFDDGRAAYNAIKRFPAVVSADIVNDDDVPCAISGDPIAEWK